MNTDPALSLPLPHRLDVKPNVFLGLTWPETLYASLIASIVSIILGAILGIILGNMMIILPVWMMVGLGLLWVIGTFMAKFKHNRPHGYYQQKIYLALQAIGIGRWYITKSGYRDPRLLNCDYSPDELQKITWETFLSKQSRSQHALERH